MRLKVRHISSFRYSSPQKSALNMSVFEQNAGIIFTTHCLGSRRSCRNSNPHRLMRWRLLRQTRSTSGGDAADGQY